jgi:hypothetical protein
MPLPAILETPFLVHDGAPGGVWAVDAETLVYLYERIVPGRSTLETGVGMSTLVFALKAARHTCIVPSAREVERVRDHCARHGVSVESIDFVVEPSERALPRLGLKDLDLVLIDGRHGFPAPMLDWYYTAAMLSLGGTLVIDDTQLWQVRVLRDFLAGQPEWELEREFSKTAVFAKAAEGCEDAEWTEQAYVLSQSERLGRGSRRRARQQEAVELLRRGRWLTLAAKARRVLAGRR